MKKASLLKVLAINALILLGLLSVLEVALRIMGVGYGNAPLNKDRVFHHVNPSNYDFVSYAEDGEFSGIKAHFNERGMLSDPQRALGQTPESVAFLGDSFTGALSVGWDSLFVGRLQQRFPNVDMLDYGVASYSPSLHYLVAKNKVLSQKKLPKTAFMLLYSNDVSDDEEYLKTAHFDPSGNLTALDGGAPSLGTDLLRRLYLVRVLRKAQITLRYAMSKKQEAAAPVVGGYVEQMPDWEGTPSADYVLKTARLLESKGVKFYLSVVPSKFKLTAKQHEVEEFSQKIEKWATAQNILFVDLVAPFRQASEQSGAALFYERDIHFNDRGHGVVAKVFAQQLTAIGGIEE